MIAVEIPSQRSSMHLDTVLTMLDVDAFTVFPDMRDAMTTYVVTPGAGGRLAVEEADDLFDAIARALDVPKIRQFETGGDRFQAEREQWDDGNNVLAIEPGVVVAYERNVDTNRRLRDGGHRGHHDRRRGARPRTRRPQVYELSHRARRDHVMTNPTA